MRVVLFQSVPNLGLAGDVVDVKPGYFRNYLEPRGYALPETPQTLNLLASKKKKIEQALLREKAQAEDAQGALSGITLRFELKAGERGRLFGSVTNRDIADALAEKGIEVDRHKIELPESIKSIGTHKARVRLHPEVVAEIDVVVEPENKEILEAMAAREAEAQAKAAAEEDSESQPAPAEPAEIPPSSEADETTASG